MTQQTIHFAGEIDTSLEVWELTLPEDEARCESQLVPCSSPATTAFSGSCGHQAGVLCETHTQQQIGEFRAFPTYILRCDHCGAEFPCAAVRWHAI